MTTPPDHYPTTCQAIVRCGCQDGNPCGGACADTPDTPPAARGAGWRVCDRPNTARRTDPHGGRPCCGKHATSNARWGWAAPHPTKVEAAR